MANSPTETVGYEVKSKLNKVKHNHPMLSLDKTKSEKDVMSFLNGRANIAMLKMDGLTISLTYRDGKLVAAETRGNGEIGEDILHNAKVFDNIPLKINYREEFIVDGEAVIDYDTFAKINDRLPADRKYANPRNLASGSVRQLDNAITAERKVKFIAWKLVKGSTENSFKRRLELLEELGFSVVPYCYADDIDIAGIRAIIQSLKELAEDKRYPIDGIVFGYDDVSYGESLGMTGHHVKSQIAFKFYDDVYPTELLNIEWTMGKTGVLTPTAVFEPVEIEGSIVERASVHNISILQALDLQVGDEIEVYKANLIIPQVARNISAEERRRAAYATKGNRMIMGTPYIPSKCPICGAETIIKTENESSVLICKNPACEGQMLGKLTHFCSKNAMNIDGLSEATLEKLIQLGWVVSFEDIYKLKDYAVPMTKLDGFGKRSVEKLLIAIEKSRTTTLDRFIYALSIPLIGRSASKNISRYFNGDYISFNKAWSCGCGFEWTKLQDFGKSMHISMMKYSQKNKEMVERLASYMNFESTLLPESTSIFDGKTFVITGALNRFANRDALKEKIEILGGKVSGAVTGKTSYLINNDIESSSGKNKKAKDLGVAIISEEQFLRMIGG